MCRTVGRQFPPNRKVTLQEEKTSAVVFSRTEDANRE